MIQSNVIPKLPSGYNIEQSLRFNDDDSAFLDRTPSVTSNRKTFTFSCWVKRCNLVRSELFLSQNSDISYYVDTIRFDAGNTFSVSFWHNANVGILTTTRLFRDTSSWYHIVIAVDTTLVLADDRVKIYVNGEEETSFSTRTNPAQHLETYFNLSTARHYFNKYSTSYSDCYMAETHFIDGQALTPDYFGEFDATYGHWKPKKYEGTYGTNGFYLPYSNGGNIGEDISGNGNNFTATNLSATDIVLDSPTNNFAVLNSLAVSTTYTEGNTRGLVTTTYRNVYSTIAMSSGKWYCELSASTATYGFEVGIYDTITLTASHNDTINNSIVYYNVNGNKIINGASTTYGLSWLNTTSVIGVAYDADNGSIEFYKDGVPQGSISVDNSVPYYFIATFASSSGSGTAYFNFGQDSSFAGNKTPQGYTDSNGIGDFYYQPPEGYLALCTANLEAIPQPYDAFVDCSTENEYFDGTYVGNGSTNGTFIYLGFLPTHICINGTVYDQTSTLFDFNANGVKCRSTTMNASGTTYTIEAWVDVDFKYGNAQ